MTGLVRPLAVLLTVIAAAALLTPAAAASASGPEVTCTAPSTNTAGFNPPLTLTPTTTTVTTTNQYGPCLSLTQLGLTSGSRSSIAVRTRSCLELLTAGTITYTITWNTGQTSTISGDITASVAGAVVVFTITGTVTAGLFTGANAVQVNTGPAADILLCTLGLGTVPSLTSTSTLQITS
jgi:hypothetical protein